MSTTGPRVPTTALNLDYPMSLGVFEKYDEAQRAVDFLSDHEFPVQNCMIVGTELKQVERITGRLTNGRVAALGAISGVWLGLFVGLIFSFFGKDSQVLGMILICIAIALSLRSWPVVAFLVPIVLMQLATAPLSAMRPRMLSALNPPKTSEWTAPIRAQASMATAASGMFGR